MAIEVKRTNESEANRAWCAIVQLPKRLELVGFGIYGAATESGPYVREFGYTPDDAVRAAMVTIGKAVVGMTDVPAKDDSKEAKAAS